ncbi:MAG: hypothetical protein AAGA29_07820 [Planctomycetota bacterium]
MNDNRRLKQAGLLAGLMQQRRDLEQRARLCLDEIESATFVVKSPLALNGHAVVVAATEFNRILKDAAEVQGRIDELEEALGL